MKGNVQNSRIFEEMRLYKIANQEADYYYCFLVFLYVLWE